MAIKPPIKRAMKMALFFMAALLAIFVAVLYCYTHRAIDRIPSDPAGVDNLTFFALGDQGTGELAQWKVARGMEKLAEKDKNLDFVILMGDNFYTDKLDSINSSEWKYRFELVYSGTYLSGVPFYAVLGNHDHLNNPKIQVEYSQKHMGSNRWRMPSPYYSADFGNAKGRPLLRVVFIDTCVSHKELVREADFIKDKFAESPSAPIWKIVVGHYPVRDYGKHSGETAEMMATILPALQQAHVDLYLAGHDHNQQVIAHDGEPLYFIAGTGGNKLHAVKQGAPDLVFSRPKLGFLKLQLDAKTLKAGYYDTDGVKETEYAIDRQCILGAAKCLQTG